MNFIYSDLFDVGCLEISGNIGFMAMVRIWVSVLETGSFES